MTILLSMLLPAIITLATSGFAAPVHLVDEAPVSITHSGTLLTEPKLFVQLRAGN